MMASVPGSNSAAPIPCSTRSDQHGDVRSQCTSERRDSEDGEADEHDLLVSAPITDRAAGQQQRRQRQCIAVDDPLQADDARTQLGTDTRQRDVDDRDVEQHQKVADAHHYQYQAPSASLCG
jgi:hypothetical protein